MARSLSARPILEVARDLDLTPAQVVPYGFDKAKVTLDALQSERPPGRLVLVSAITPTDAGEGKTTTSIGPAQGFTRLGQGVCLALREPSLGPTFGQKGGATGGGWARVVPESDIMRMPGLPASPQAERMDLVDGAVVQAPGGPGSTTSASA